MKIFLKIVLSVFILSACDSKLENQKGKNAVAHKIQKSRTLEINKHKYVEISKDNKFISLISINGDTIIKPQDYYFNLEILDINTDGYDDLRVFEFANTPNQCENYIFDSTSQSFQFIENCDLDIKMVTGSDFYYSYNRAGCSDMNWESHLGKIEDEKFVIYGYIFGRGCESESKKNKLIEIYKISNNDKHLITKLPYSENIKEFDQKWNFIENYWKENKTKFE